MPTPLKQAWFKVRPEKPESTAFISVVLIRFYLWPKTVNYTGLAIQIVQVIESLRLQ